MCRVSIFVRTFIDIPKTLTFCRDLRPSSNMKKIYSVQSSAQSSDVSPGHVEIILPVLNYLNVSPRASATLRSASRPPEHLSSQGEGEEGGANPFLFSGVTLPPEFPTSVSSVSTETVKFLRTLCL